MKQVQGTFHLEFTTEQESNLPSAHTMKNELSDLFAVVVDNYLSNLDVEGEEVHLITADEFYIEDCE